MTLEVRKVFKIKKRIVRRRGEGAVGSNYFSSFHKRNIFLRGQAEDNLMLSNDRTCVRGCEMIPLAIDIPGMCLINCLRARVIFLSSESTEEASWLGAFTVSTDMANSTTNVTNSGFWNICIDLVLGIQLCFRRFPIDGFSSKWWSK